jgi:hypothetical protein
MNIKEIELKLKKLKIKTGDYILLNTMDTGEYVVKYHGIIANMDKMYIQGECIGITANQNIDIITSIKKLITVG